MHSLQKSFIEYKHEQCEKFNSFTQHPTEGSQEEVMQQSSDYNACLLRKTYRDDKLILKNLAQFYSIIYCCEIASYLHTYTYLPLNTYFTTVCSY